MLDLLIRLTQQNQGVRMKLESEDVVTRMLVQHEILNFNSFNDEQSDYMINNCTYNSKYNLGDYLKDIKPEPSKYGEKYIFVR